MANSKVLTSPNPPSREPGTVIVETDRLIVRRFLETDAPGIAAAANFESIAANLRDRFPSPFTLDHARESVAAQSRGPEGGFPGPCALVLKADAPGNGSGAELLIGGVATHLKPDVYWRTWEMGYWITPAHWGRGYATEALGALVRWAFRTWPRLNRVESEVYARNPASVRVLNKIGFVEEGRQRENIEKNGELLGSVLMGCIRSDLGL